MHGNWDAFAAVLRRVRRKRFDATLVLGDLVGYGAGPNQVVEAVRDLEGVVHVVRGNHDKVVCQLEDGSNFNQPALAAARWTTERLTPANLRYVKEMPLGPVEIENGLHICHGSPLDEDTYVFSIYDAYEIFTNYDAEVVFFGHTHIPSLFVQQEKGIEVAVVQGESFTRKLEPGNRYLCIVRAPTRLKGPAVQLPFDGDGTLSVILSKALLLANDDKITDPQIRGQIV